MTREFFLVGVIAIAFGVGSFYGTGAFGGFSRVNLVLGGVAVAISLAIGLRRLRFVGGPDSRRVILRGLALIVAAVAVVTLLERVAARSQLRSDWTLEQSFDPSPAVLAALEELPGTLEATLFADPHDPRARRTRLLLRTFGQIGDLNVRERKIEEAPEEEDRYGVGSSNTVVLELGGRFEVVERPTEGTLYEALYRLRSLDSGVVTLLRGEGEGDVQREDDLGFSGLGNALATEGYGLRSAVTAAMTDVPPETDVLLVIAPKRAFRPEAVAAIERFLAGGGRLVALLEPGIETGIEGLLAVYGLSSPDGLLVDPASGAVEGRPAGVCPIAFNYESHPITRGLDSNRMTFFCGVRTFELSKPERGDRLHRIVLSSARGWLSSDLSLLDQRGGSPDSNGARQDYRSIVAAGRYERNDAEIRIVAFGDSEFASNRHLRTLYNLDLILNAVHWAAAEDARITLRPKIRSTVQFPLPLVNTLRTLYGVGLLVPELLLMGGGLVWLRRRNS